MIKIINWEELKKLSVNDMETTFLVKNRDGKDMVNTLRHILAKNYVRYVGDPVLAIIAETLEIAESVADNIEINYEELDNVTNISSSLKNSSVSVRKEVSNNICFDWELGDKEESQRANKLICL